MTATALALELPITAQDYLEGEKISDIRHQFVEGEIFMMAGASDKHVTVTGNVFALLKAHLRGSGCRTYMADMKVEAKQNQAYFYPDVMVCCEEADKKRDYIKQSPKLIVEVLSSSTEAFDRGQKFSLYRQINSLKEYILINPNKQQIEIFRLNEKKHWELFEFNSQQQTIEFASLNFQCELVDIYEDVELT